MLCCVDYNMLFCVDLCPVVLVQASFWCGAGCRDGAAAAGGPSARGPPGPRAPAVCCTVWTYAQLSSCMRFWVRIGLGAGCLRTARLRLGGPSARGPPGPRAPAACCTVRTYAQLSSCMRFWVRIGLGAGLSGRRGCGWGARRSRAAGPSRPGRMLYCADLCPAVLVHAFLGADRLGCGLSGRRGCGWGAQRSPAAGPSRPGRMLYCADLWPAVLVQASLGCALACVCVIDAAAGSGPGRVGLASRALSPRPQLTCACEPAV